MALAYVILSSLTAFGSAGVVWGTGGSFWSGVGTFYLTGFGTIAALIAWQFMAQSLRRGTTVPIKTRALPQ